MGIHILYENLNYTRAADKLTRKPTMSHSEISD